ncbi:MAG TPA: hypothetical protein VIH59_19175 [Candidatus Tectomicrobia bacterium]|jgi:MFS family permease
MATAGSRPSWIDGDVRLVITTRALRSFAQSAVAVLIAIYLGLQGFSLVQVGAFFTIGSVGVAVAAVVTGVLGDAVGRRRTRGALSYLMALSGVGLVVSEHFIVLLLAAFLGNLSGLVGGGGGGGGMGPLEQAVLAGSTTPQRRTALFALFSLIGTSAGSLGALASGCQPCCSAPSALGSSPPSAPHSSPTPPLAWCSVLRPTASACTTGTIAWCAAA